MDVLVLGGGPAGVTAAIYAARSGKSVTLLYRDGGALARAEKIGNYYGFPEPLTGPDLFQRGLSQAEALGVQVLQAQILSLGFGPGGLEAETTAGTFSARAVVLATGIQRRRPGIPGLKELEGAGVSYCAVCDGFFCRGKEVAVLGAGEYALHEARVLLPLAARVHLLTGGQPAPQAPDMEVDTRPIAALEESEGRLSGVRFEDGTALPVSHLFVALGSAGSGDLARKVGILTENGNILTDETMATNVPGLFAAGDCTGGLLQVAKAAAQGAQAGLSAAKYAAKHP